MYFESVDQTVIKCRQNGKVIVIPTECKHSFKSKIANAGKYVEMKNFLVNKINYIEQELIEKKEAKSASKGVVVDDNTEMKEKFIKEFKEFGNSRDWAEGVEIDDNLEWFRQLNCENSDEMLPGVFVIDLCERNILCKDEELNLIRVYDDGHYQIEHVKTIDQELEDKLSFYYDFNNVKPLEIQPRFFVVNNDNTAYELLNKDMLSYYETIY